MSLIVKFVARKAKNKNRSKAQFRKSINCHKRKRFIEAALYYRRVEHGINA